MVAVIFHQNYQVIKLPKNHGNNSCIIVKLRSSEKTVLWKDYISHILSYEECNVYLLYIKETDAEIRALKIKY